MVPFLIAALFGAGEMWLLKCLISALTAGRKDQMISFALIKFITYGVAIWLLVFKFFTYYLYAFCGFAVGLPLSAVIYFIYCSFFKNNS